MIQSFNLTDSKATNTNKLTTNKQCCPVCDGDLNCQHITSILAPLHWLSIEYRTGWEINFWIRKSLHGISSVDMFLNLKSAQKGRLEDIKPNEKELINGLFVICALQLLDKWETHPFMKWSIYIGALNMSLHDYDRYQFRVIVVITVIVVIYRNIHP